MTKSAETAKPSARSAQIGENYVCPRCKGAGGSKAWVVDFGTCFKCNGAGVVTKPDPNAVFEETFYIVECNQVKQYISSNDPANLDLNLTAWIGDTLSFRFKKDGPLFQGVILGKRYTKKNGKGDVLELKKSKNFDNLPHL